VVSPQRKLAGVGLHHLSMGVLQKSFSSINLKRFIVLLPKMEKASYPC
jgi:hypothetical protein